jgi:Domain of unknown function (DUF4386)
MPEWITDQLRQLIAKSSTCPIKNHPAKATTMTSFLPSQFTFRGDFMNRPSMSEPGQITAKFQLAASLLVFLSAATLPYLWLVAHFGYDDILREPTADILQKFHAGGSSLVLAWLGFALSALLFIPVALAFRKLMSAYGLADQGSTALAIASAVAQTIGLLRWVLVVPWLAGIYVNTSATASSKETVLLVFEAVHRYGGMVIGEMVGQLLLMGWTALIATQLYRSRLIPRWLSTLGLLTVPFWLVGQTELLHKVVPAIVSVEVIPVAFMAWEGWLLGIAVVLLADVWRERKQVG